MLDRDVNPHDGCPNRGHCRKDESKCCYLLSNNNQCYIDSRKSEDFI